MNIKLTVFLFFGTFYFNAIHAKDNLVQFNNYQIIEEKTDSLQKNISFALEEKIDSLIEFSKQFIGLKYRYGSANPKGFDCSGFVGYVFSQFGYKLGRTSSEQYKNGIPVYKKDTKPGDLVFFQEKNRNGTYRISHVGIIVSVNVEDETFCFIHSCRRGILIDNSTMEYYHKRFYGIRRIIVNE